jgi:uncharacterized protein (DUF58 family)
MKWILAAIVLLVAGLALKLSLLVYAMYVLLASLMLSRFFTRAWTENLQATRLRPEDVLEIGNSVEMRVAVENKGRLVIPWVLLEDSLPRDILTQVPLRLKAEGFRLALVRLKGGESILLDYKVTFLMRGYYQFGPLCVETGDVLGLHRRFRVMAEPHYVMVLPKVVALEGYSLASRRPMGEIRVTHRLYEDPTRIAGVRPYQQGDPINRIHWRATARTGVLHSRYFESTRVAGATLLLDFHVGSFPGADAIQAAELSIVTVASVANSVCLMGQQIGFVSNGRDAADRIRTEGWGAEFGARLEAQKAAAASGTNERLRPVMVETGRGVETYTRILETLARLEFTDGLEFAVMVEEAAARIRRDATVVAVLNNVTAETADALGSLVRRGFLVTAVVVAYGEEDIPLWAHPPEWAEMLLGRNVDFRLVTSEASISSLCAEAIVR